MIRDRANGTGAVLLKTEQFHDIAYFQQTIHIVIQLIWNSQLQYIWDNTTNLYFSGTEYIACFNLSNTYWWARACVQIAAPTANANWLREQLNRSSSQQA